VGCYRVGEEPAVEERRWSTIVLMFYP
jgi:hypothetical protein